jgi:hypothetical protein
MRYRPEIPLSRKEVYREEVQEHMHCRMRQWENERFEVEKYPGFEIVGRIS